MNTARQTANQANAQKSTGPRTAEGKETSSRNAITTALTGRTILLPSDDLEAYERHVQSFNRKFEPLTDYEYSLVQTLADTAWRMARIPHLMMALDTKAHEDFANDFQDMEPAARSMRIQMEGFLKYEKQYRNLQLQEARLHRRLEKDTAELRLVIREREAKRGKELEVASLFYLAAQTEKKAFHPADLGFEFSTHDVVCFLEAKKATEIAMQHPMMPRRDLLSL